MTEIQQRAITALRPHPRNHVIYGDKADEDLVASVRQHGVMAPLLVTREGLIISGHRRWQAAERAGLKQVPVVEFWSSEEHEVLRALVESNRWNRIKTTEQLIREYDLWLEIERWFAHQRQATLNNDSLRANLHEATGKASDFAAERVGRKPRTMEKGHQVVEAIDGLEARGGVEMADDLRAELNGKSIDAAHRTAQAWGLLVKPEPAPPPATDEYPLLTLSAWRDMSAAERNRQLFRPQSNSFTFNNQSTTKIEWAEWSWNPVTGCKHDCSYCYARDIALGRGRIAAFAQGFEPTLLPERLSAPRNTHLPANAADHIGAKNVFTCSMADLFGRWVPRQWIDAVLDVVHDSPQWNFLFLTKFPQRLAEFDFPPNAWVGTTIDAQARVKVAEEAFANVNASVRWLSIEPLLEPLQFAHLERFDWLAIGGASASSETPAWHPPLSWVADLEHQAQLVGAKVYHKSNLYVPRREYPGAPVHELPEIADVFHMRYLQRDVLEPRAYAREMRQ